MAYGNWGAFVYRNGDRMEGYEDKDGYHAELEGKLVVLRGYKCYPSLEVDGKSVDIDDYAVKSSSSNPEYKGIIEAADGEYEFSATMYNDNMVDLYLREPDGTVWESTCGYAYGAGWMD